LQSEKKLGLIQSHRSNKKMKPRLPALLSSVIAAALVIFSAGQPAFAQTTGSAIEVPGVRNFVAAAVGVVPDYLGSDDYTIGAAPAGVIRFGDSDRYVRLIVTDINVNLIDSPNWSFGPAINYRLGRSDVDDKAVDKMRDIDGTVEVGAFGGWTWIGSDDPRHRFSIGTEFLYDVGGEHDGYLISGSVRYFKPVTRPLTLTIGAAMTYGSGDYMDTYFGVSTGDAARSGLSAFNADSGLRDIRVPLMAIFSFNKNWHVSGGVVYTRLLNDAADSPVVDDRGSKDQLFAGLGIAYAW
jgi:outer membrane protein